MRKASSHSKADLLRPLRSHAGPSFATSLDRRQRRGSGRLGHVTVRSIYVDERMGIVALRLSWNVRGPGSDKLTAFELFKVYGGQIHKVEAFIRLFPPALELGGWPVTVSQP